MDRHAVQDVPQPEVAAGAQSRDKLRRHRGSAPLPAASVSMGARPATEAGALSPILRGYRMRVLLFAALTLVACTAGPAETAALRAGGYHYSARSAAGQPLLDGRLEIRSVDDSTLRGTWEIAWVAGADMSADVGPQVGSGTLTGSRRGDTLLIQLNPTYADNNVVLQAVSSADGYAGHWEWNTITGPRTAGPFVASVE